MADRDGLRPGGVDGVETRAAGWVVAGAAARSGAGPEVGVELAALAGPAGGSTSGAPAAADVAGGALPAGAGWAATVGGGAALGGAAAGTAAGGGSPDPDSFLIKSSTARRPDCDWARFSNSLTDPGWLSCAAALNGTRAAKRTAPEINALIAIR